MIVVESRGDEMRIGDVCDRRIPIAAAGTTVLAAAKSMHGFGEHMLVVTEEREGKVVAVGIVTERDLVGVIALEGAPNRLTLRDVMGPPPAFVVESDNVFETVCWMRRNHLRDVVVHDQAGRLLGTVSIDQLVEGLAGELGEDASSAGGELPPQQRPAFH
jgi:signal-transduction protein with cAMP-binding, CBS, and nucleotidyltransferase domain